MKTDLVVSPLRVLILVGNPAKRTYGDALADAYARGAESAGAEVRTIRLSELHFDPILHEGYRTVQNLEPDLLEAQQSIVWAQHLVIIYPVWWGSVPALLKGFLDRAFHPEFAYRRHEKGPRWEKLLKGRSAHLIATSDAPSLLIRLLYRNCDAAMMKRAVLNFCGIAPVRLTRIGGIQGSTLEYRVKWLERVRKLGERLGPRISSKSEALATS